jgi:hypothetical protein
MAKGVERCIALPNHHNNGVPQPILDIEQFNEYEDNGRE